MGQNRTIIREKLKGVKYKIGYFYEGHNTIQQGTFKKNIFTETPMILSRTVPHISPSYNTECIVSNDFPELLLF